MIQLRNVSKYYYSKGMISSGISKVNLDFDLGEFVVITGESGSGKSTLLNVISGLDSYEEGEMYINGAETSHYLASDFEEYRKKYIGNIFQNFNLVNSYTVFQNIELILLINGYQRPEIKRRVSEIIERVGLTEFTGTKVSKLSGGQRQRVSIARALAKDTDIIVADEPTGNLDSESARGIAELLSEIARDKLVIVVTHNYDQFEEFATRRVKMHDGKVIENTRVRRSWQVPEERLSGGTGFMSGGSQLRLGVRNTFNIFYKFLLLLAVFLFLVFAISSQYTTLINKQYEQSEMGYSNYFMNYSNDRIVLKKQDNSEFKDEDYDALARIDNVRMIAPNDVLLDSTLYLENDFLSYEAYPRSVGELNAEPDYGRLPEKPGEALLKGQNDEYNLNDDLAQEILDQKLRIDLLDGSSLEVTVVGVAFDTEEDPYRYAGEVYMDEEQIKEMRKGIYSSGSSVIILINNKEMVAGMSGGLDRIAPSSKVKKGEAIVAEDVSNYFTNNSGDADLGMDPDAAENPAQVNTAAVNQDLGINVKNMFYSENVKLKIADVYTEKTFKDKTGNESYDENFGTVFISQTDYDKLFGKGNYQCSVFVDEVKELDKTVQAIRALGYTALPLKDTVTIDEDEDIQSMLEIPITILIIVAIFVIAYIVAGLILRSRSTYFSILRMLGLARKSIRTILDVEVLLVMNIAFVIFLAVVMAVRYEYINVAYLMKLIQFLKPRDFVVLYAMIAAMSLLISRWFARRLFKKTAMGSFREEE